MAFLPPLDSKQSIVDADTGKPSLYFLHYLRSRGGALTDIEAQLLALLERQVIAGDGLDGGGPLSSDVTLTADVQEILDQITTTQGSVLYRGASAWAALAPGTSGQYLKTQGAGANPTWGTVSSGGAWSLITTTTISSPVSNVDFTSLDSYSNLMMIARNVTQNASGYLALRVSTDNGSTYRSTAGDYATVTTGGSESATGNTEFRMIDATASAARTGVINLWGSNVNGGPKLATFNNSQGHKGLFLQSTAPINAVRLFSTSGNTLLAGTVYLFGM